MSLMVTIGIARGMDSEILYGTEDDVRALQEQYPDATIKYSTRFGEIHNFIQSHVNEEMDKYRKTLRIIKKISKVQIIDEYKKSHKL